MLGVNCSSRCNRNELKLVLEYELVNLKVFSLACRWTIYNIFGRDLIFVIVTTVSNGRNPLRLKGLCLQPKVYSCLPILVARCFE